MGGEVEMRYHEDHIHDTIIQQLLTVYCMPQALAEDTEKTLRSNYS